MKSLRLFFLLTALVVSLAACDSGNSVFNAEVGDCFNDAEAGASEVSSLDNVECSEPHDNEIYHLVDMPGEGDAPFPGDEAVKEYADEQCINAFEGYVGLSYPESELVYFPIQPTAETWAEGDREIICVLYDGSMAEMTGSMRDSNR